MEKISTVTTDITAENEAKLLELFPQVATEVEDESGDIHRAVDFDALRELLGDVAEGQRERYRFTWPGKRAAKEESRKATSNVMIPCPGKSVDWHTTGNLYVEGDNLEALKILRDSYAGSVKIIYIDPPYNTGNDFVYDDDFAQSAAEYAEDNGDYDETGGRLVRNLNTNGKFHSNWCSMMLPRLTIARDLLSEDGVIFISIDQREAKNLEAICDEVFGSACHVETIVWKNKYGAGAKTVGFIGVHEYIYCYSKKPIMDITCELDEEGQKRFNKRDSKFESRGSYMTQPLMTNSLADRENLMYPIEYNGEIIYPRKQWVWSKERLLSAIERDEVEFSRQADGTYSVRSKCYLKNEDGQMRRGKPTSLLTGPFNQVATEHLRDLFDGKNIFDFTKPFELIKYLISLQINGLDGRNDLIMDFFSGSGTTAEAVLRLNAADGGSRRFIMVQIPEETGGDYANLCEIGEERIRRAGAKIVAEIEEENKQLKLGEEPKRIPDVGFRVLRIDSSNFRDTKASPDAYEQATLLDYMDNLKEGRTPLDLLFQVLPAFRIPYSASIEEAEVAGKSAFVVNGGQLVACFDLDLDNAAIEEIAKMEPVYAVFRDASLADDATAANLEELFKTYSPDTVRKVI